MQRRRITRHAVMVMLGVATAITAIMAAGGGTASGAATTWSPTGPCGVAEATAAPADAVSMTVAVAGAAGGKSGSQSSDGVDAGAPVAGGAGSKAIATFAVSGGQQVAAIVGCAGIDGGTFDNLVGPEGYSRGGSAGRGFEAGNATGTGASAGTGGGSSGVCLGTSCKSTKKAATLVVAGGGGGGGVANCVARSIGVGGAAGASTLTSDAGAVGTGPSGDIGTDGDGSGGSGGRGGANNNGIKAAGDNSSNPSDTSGSAFAVVGGGGGGGYRGGGDGHKGSAITTGPCRGGGGGGGGSSWVASTGTGTSFAPASAAAVVITFSTTGTTTSTSTSTSTSTTTTTTVPSCQPDIVPFASVAALVDRQIADFGASTSIRTPWITSITNCTKTADDLILSLLPPSQTTNDAKIFRVYNAYFLRSPDVSGFNHYLSDLLNGRALANIATEFSVSGEFQQRYGNLDNGSFVDLLYLNILNRTPDQAGRTFWMRQLSTRTQDRGQVVLEFSESPENISHQKPLVDVFRMLQTMRQNFPTTTEFADLANPILIFQATEASSAAYAIRHSAGYASRFG